RSPPRRSADLPHGRVIGSVLPARGGVAAPETHSASRPAQSTGTGYHHASASLLWERPWPRSAGTIASMAAPTGLLPTSGLPARGTGLLRGLRLEQQVLVVVAEV